LLSEKSEIKSLIKKVKTAKNVVDELAESNYFLGECKGKLIIPAFLLKARNCLSNLTDLWKTSINFYVEIP